MTAITKDDNRLFAVYGHFKIADADIEIKENQYMNIDADYYKALKTKPHKASFEARKQHRSRDFK